MNRRQAALAFGFGLGFRWVASPVQGEGCRLAQERAADKPAAAGKHKLAVLVVGCRQGPPMAAAGLDRAPVEAESSKVGSSGPAAGIERHLPVGIRGLDASRRDRRNTIGRFWRP